VFRVEFETAASDDFRVRRLRVDSRLLTQHNAEVSRVGALSAPARPKQERRDHRRELLLLRGMRSVTSSNRDCPDRSGVPRVLHFLPHSGKVLAKPASSFVEEGTIYEALTTPQLRKEIP
jgi:hypothetical protein